MNGASSGLAFKCQTVKCGFGPTAAALSSELANRLELIAVSVDFTWCCVFSHEAGSWVWEQLFERESGDNRRL